MDRLKYFLVWILIVIGFYLYSNLMIYIALHHGLEGLTWIKLLLP